MAKSKHNFCVIMAGGIGARFWPMSRTTHPKQFIDILGTGETLIQQTYKRFKRICPKENIYIDLERRMKCGVGKCGHCQMEGIYVCQEGPVFNYAEVEKMEELL